VSCMSQENIALETANMSGFREVLGFAIEEWGPGYAVITAPVQPRHLNRNGLVHGGVFASLLDSAAGLCGTYCTVPGNVRRCITISMSTQFVNAVKEGFLRVESRMVSRGRKIFFADVSITCEGKVIATGQFSLKYVSGGEDDEGVSL